MITQEQLKEATERMEALKRYLDIENKKIEVEEEELRTHVADLRGRPRQGGGRMRKNQRTSLLDRLLYGA